MKSFFARTVDSGGFLGERDFGVVKYTPNKGTEKVSPILFLTGKKIDAPGMKDPTGEEKKKEQKRLDSGQEGEGPAGAAGILSLRGKLVEIALAPEQPRVLRPQHRQSHGASLLWPGPGDAARSGAQRERRPAIRSCSIGWPATRPSTATT